MRGRSAVAQLLAQFTHFFALILWTAAGLAALAEAWNPANGMAALAAAVVAVILINGLSVRSSFVGVYEIAGPRAI